MSDRELTKRGLKRTLWNVIGDVDSEGETEGGVKLSNEDIIEILQSIIDSLSPIDFSFKNVSDKAKK